MSMTQQAFMHWRDAARLAAAHEGTTQYDSYRAQAGTWARRLPELIRRDFTIPPHMTVSAMDPVYLGCDRCGGRLGATTPYMVGTFVDDHVQCGEVARTWDCPNCGLRELEHRRSCRHCGVRRGELPVRATGWAVVLADYDVLRRWRAEWVLAAELRAPSLGAAKRAARGIFPREVMLVRLRVTGDEWEV